MCPTLAGSGEVVSWIPCYWKVPHLVGWMKIGVEVLRREERKRTGHSMRGGGRPGSRPCGL